MSSRLREKEGKNVTCKKERKGIKLEGRKTRLRLSYREEDRADGGQRTEKTAFVLGFISCVIVCLSFFGMVHCLTRRIPTIDEFFPGRPEQRLDHRVEPR